MKQNEAAFEGAAAITGLGAVSAWGLGIDALWLGLSSGSTGIGDFSRFDHQAQRTHVAGEAPIPPTADEDRGDDRGNDRPESTNGRSVSTRRERRLSLADRFALEAGQDALAQARQGGHGTPAIDPDRLDRVGVFFGGSTAGMYESEELFAAWRRGEIGRRGRFGRLASQTINNPADAVARAFGVTGPVETISSACASGTQALGTALDALRSGEVDVAIAGGADSLCRLTYAGFNSLRAVDAQPCRPFRAERAGMSLGEGAGVLVLESAEAAMARGARVLAWLRGSGASCDAHHMTAPEPGGAGAARAIREALRNAGASASDIDFVNAHGTGTPLNDASEWRGLVEVFGDRASDLPLTSTKGAVGHLLGSSGAIEAVATVLCLLHGAVHPTPGEGTADPELPARLVRGEPLAVESLNHAISTSFGFGGANAVAVFSRSADG